MPLMTAKSSTIFISVAGRTEVYHSVSDIPLQLRRQLEESTQRSTAATILIADKRGREELSRALQGEPSSVQCRLAETLRHRQTRAVRFTRRWPAHSLRRWLGLLIPLAIGGGLWALLEFRL